MRRRGFCCALNRIHSCQPNGPICIYNYIYAYRYIYNINIYLKKYFVCVWVIVCVCKGVCECECVYVCTYACKYIYVSVCLCLCACVHICACMRAFACVCVCVCVMDEGLSSNRHFLSIKAVPSRDGPGEAMVHFHCSCWTERLMLCFHRNSGRTHNEKYIYIFIDINKCHFHIVIMDRRGSREEWQANIKMEDENKGTHTHTHTHTQGEDVHKGHCGGQ